MPIVCYRVAQFATLYIKLSAKVMLFHAHQFAQGNWTHFGNIFKAELLVMALVMSLNL